MQPPFRSCPAVVPLDAARAALPSAEPGWVFWDAGSERLDCVIAVQPNPMAGTLARQALCDALGALGPPYTVAIAVDDAVQLNGAVVGSVSLENPPDAAVDLVVVHVAVADPMDEAPGLHPDRTVLYEEGFPPEVDGKTVLDTFLRHLLSHAYRAEEASMR
ncbi:MAG: biotin/lipoate--protein ligase family protein [Rhodospirillaceae bacterium]